MSVTNKKLDALRRLLLGSLYDECKSNPMGVSRERLEEHLQKIKDEGCIGECTLDEFVKTCQLNTHYPTCVSSDYRGCVEGIGEKSRGVEKVYYDQYKRAKLIEDEPDDEDEDEGEMCNVCYLTGEDDEGKPVEQMSCGHYSHKNCLLKIAKEKGKDNAECPECRKVFSLDEVPVPVRTLQQRQADSARRYEFNASQMGFDASRRRPMVDLVDDGIVEESSNIRRNISENHIEEAINGIRNFYTRQFNTRTVLNQYTTLWISEIINKISEEDITIQDLRRLLDTIFSSNLSITINNNYIKTLNRLLTTAPPEQGEQIIYIIKAFAKYYADRQDANLLGFYIQVIIVNKFVNFLEQIFEDLDSHNMTEILRESMDVVFEDIDLHRINAETKELITNWFTSHNYQPPSFEEEHLDAEQMSEAIINYIRDHSITEAIESIQEYYIAGHDVSEYSDEWFLALMSEIDIGQIGTTNLKRIVDAIVEGGLVTIRRVVIRNINRKKLHYSLRELDDQYEQIMYIFEKVVKELIEEHPEEDAFGLLVDDVVSQSMTSLLEEIINIVDEKNAIELFKRSIIAIINFSGINNEGIKEIIINWFRRHNLTPPSSFEPEQYSGESESDDD